MPYDFGLRLTKVRKQNGLTQNDVAQRLGLNRATISGYENNTITPSLEILKSMAIMYNVSADYLLNISVTPTIAEKEDQYLLQLDVINQMQRTLSELQQQIKELKNIANH